MELEILNINYNCILFFIFNLLLIKFIFMARFLIVSLCCFVISTLSQSQNQSFAIKNDKILVIVAHPNFDKSRVNASLISRLKGRKDITVHNLYSKYENFQINTEKEITLLKKYDKIVIQFPMMWYSAPPLLKLWIDQVLTKIAHSENFLKDRKIMLVVTCGGKYIKYVKSNDNKYSINELLSPLEETFKYLGMKQIKPFYIFNTPEITDDQLVQYGQNYVKEIVAQY
jgi:glutathione-regulated potassium-efflux system ancillary protein KefG